MWGREMGSRLTHWSERISIINIAAVSCCCASQGLLQKIYFTHTHAWGSLALCGLCSSSEFAANIAVSAAAVAAAAAQRNWLLNYCQLQLIIFLSFSDFLYIQTAGANAHVCAHTCTHVCMHVYTYMCTYVWMWLVSYDFTSHHTSYPSPLQFQPLSIHNVSFASEMAETTYIHTYIHIYLIWLKQLHLYKLTFNIIIYIIIV